MDWRVSANGSVKGSKDQRGLIPTSASSSAVNSSSSTLCSPQSVWCNNTISRVPKDLWERQRDRMTSSVTTPPALRTICASPFDRPRILKISIRESMHATTAKRMLGATAKSLSSNLSAKSRLLIRSWLAFGAKSRDTLEEATDPLEQFASFVALYEAVSKRRALQVFLLSPV